VPVPTLNDMEIEWLVKLFNNASVVFFMFAPRINNINHSIIQIMHSII
jgi:hypothetical protein